MRDPGAKAATAEVMGPTPRAGPVHLYPEDSTSSVAEMEKTDSSSVLEPGADRGGRESGDDERKRDIAVVRVRADEMV
jgi:hypothetical protein